MRKKALSPAHRRAVAKQVLEAGMCSRRSACRILRLARSTYGYQGRPASSAEQQMRKRLHELSTAHPRYGYRRIAALLSREGWKAGKRHIQRLRRMEGLRVPPTKRKIVRRGVSTGLPTQATRRGNVWTWDFIADATMRGGSLRMLTILDEYTRECHVLRADRALRSADVLEWLAKAIEQHGASEYLRKRQRERVYCQDRAAMACREPGQDHLHRSRQPMAERVRGKLPRTLPRRMPEPGTTLDAYRSPSGD